MLTRNTVLFIMLVLLGCARPAPPAEQSMEFIKGIYGNPATLINAGYALYSLGVNAVFVRSASLNQMSYDAFRAQGCNVFVEFPTLNGWEYLQQYPDAWPIDEKGEQSPAADWFMGICPTHAGFREYRMNQLTELLEAYEIDGIFLDYFHLHAQFETPDPILPETCFCDRCTSQFGQYARRDIVGATIPERAEWILENADSDWRAWRSQVLNSWATDLGTALKARQPNALLGIYYCAWYPTDFEGALYRTLGIDVTRLAEHADVLAPMLYHKMMDRPTSWVSEYIAWLDDVTRTSEKGRPEIWPIIQAHNKPGIITAEEFREVMVNGSRPPSSGIMMFSEVSLMEDREKIEVMKQLYVGSIR